MHALKRIMKEDRKSQKMSRAGRQPTLAVWSGVVSDEGPFQRYPVRWGEPAGQSQPSRQGDGKCSAGASVPGVWQPKWQRKWTVHLLPPQEGKLENLGLLELPKQKGDMNLFHKHSQVSRQTHGKAPIQITCRKKTYIQLKFSKYLWSFYHGQIIMLG